MSPRASIMCCAVGLILLCDRTTLAEDHPLSNGTGKVWQIAYHEDKPKKNHAARLSIPAIENNGNKKKLEIKEAVLYQFTKPIGVSKKYQNKKDDEGGKVILKGTVIRADSDTGGGKNYWKKAGSDFLLYGTYWNSDGDIVLVTVRGTFHPGKKNRKHTEAADARNDDRVSFAITEKVLKPREADAETAQHSAKDDRSGDPCDEMPPDAAGEESAPDPPDFPYEPNQG